MDIKQERVDREEAIDRILAQSDPQRIKAGVEAYNRDLPQLLKDGKERHVVAYDGAKQVAIAETRAALFAELKKQGIANNKSILIKLISSQPEREGSRSNFL